MLVYQRVIQLYSATFSQMYGNCGAYIYIYMCALLQYICPKDLLLLFFFVLGSGQVRKIKGWFGILVYTCYMKHVGYCGRILPNLVQVGFLGWFPYWSHQMSSDLSVAQPPTTLHCDMVLVCSFELASPSSLDDIFVFWICLDYFTHDVIEYNI